MYIFLVDKAKKTGETKKKQKKNCTILGTISELLISRIHPLQTEHNGGNIHVGENWNRS